MTQMQFLKNLFAPKAQKTDVAFEGDKIEINGKALALPTDYDSLVAALGEPTRHKRTEKTRSHMMVWDAHGIYTTFSSYGSIFVLSFLTRKQPLKKGHLHPRSPFQGTVTIDGQLVESIGNEQIIHNAHVLSEISIDGTVYGFMVRQIFENELPQLPTAPLDDGYQYLEPLWQNWINAVHRVVKPTNRFYDLKAGISLEDIQKHTQLDKDTTIPAELINFYKVHDVKNNSVCSSFQFALNDIGNVSYDLIQFKNIFSQWDSIQMLYTDDLDDGTCDGYDKRVRADNYANPKWIPLATTRDGDYLLYDTDPSEHGTYGQIILLENETWERSVVAPSLRALIQDEIKLIKNGHVKHYDYIVENG